MAGINISGLSAEIEKQLGLYSREIVKAVNAETKKAANDLKKDTKANAPKDTGEYQKHIAVKRTKTDAYGNETYEWYVRDPEYRITHLLNDGHVNRDGSFTKGTGFLDKAVEKVSEEYPSAVAKAVKKCSEK